MKHHLLQLLFPGETVTSALKRLSGRSSSSSNNRGKFCSSDGNNNVSTIQDQSSISSSALQCLQLYAAADRVTSTSINTIVN